VGWGEVRPDVRKLKSLQVKSSASVVGSSFLPLEIKWKSMKVMTFASRQNQRDICHKKWSINDQNEPLK